jgi:hypothetical protein
VEVVAVVVVDQWREAEAWMIEDMVPFQALALG